MNERKNVSNNHAGIVVLGWRYARRTTDVILLPTRVHRNYCAGRQNWKCSLRGALRVFNLSSLRVCTAMFVCFSLEITRRTSRANALWHNVARDAVHFVTRRLDKSSSIRLTTTLDDNWFREWNSYYLRTKGGERKYIKTALFSRFQYKSVRYKFRYLNENSY